jgi:hypothetical protein
MILSNRGADGDTWETWRFYARVRRQFVDWNHVILAFVDDDPRLGKLVKFVDDHGNALELHGITYGYEGGTPGELVMKLFNEGFENKARVEAIVFNPQGNQKYPTTIVRD